MNIADHIDRGATEYPERAALIFEGITMSYRQCAEWASNAATVFKAAGVRTGDRIALFLPNVPEFVVAYLGAVKLGAIAVSINSGFQRDEVGFILKDCGVKVVVTAPELMEHVAADSVERIFTIGDSFRAELAEASLFPTQSMHPADPAIIVYTSGTTGKPKGATLSHSNVVQNIQAKARYLDIKSDDRGLLFLPLYHCFGQNAVLNAMLQAGGTVVLHRRFDLDAVVESITRDRVTMFFGVPATFQLFLDRVSRESLSTVRYYFAAAARLPLDTEDRWARKFGKPIHQGYGLTETSPFASYNHHREYRPGSIGTPIDGVEMKIVDPETGTELPAGKPGEIAIRGHNVMLGYWNRPEDTAKVIRDRWFYTGDIGRVDDRGYFYIEDRLDDMINSGGVNVYPAEIENALYCHPAIAEAAVYGVREPLLGEQVFADIVLKCDAKVSEGELRTFCKERLAAFKVPSVILYVDHIPKSPTGKVLKRVLRDRAAARLLPADRHQRDVTLDQATHWIGTWLSTNLQSAPRSQSGPGSTFADLGMDSVLAVRLAMELSRWLGREMPVTIAWNFPTAGSLARHVASGRSDRRWRNDGIELPSAHAAEAALIAELESLNR